MMVWFSLKHAEWSSQNLEENLEFRAIKKVTDSRPAAAMRYIICSIKLPILNLCREHSRLPPQERRCEGFALMAGIGESPCSHILH